MEMHAEMHDDAPLQPISDDELRRMLVFQIGVSTRRIAKLAGGLESPRLRERLLRLIDDLATTGQTLQSSTSESEMCCSACGAPSALHSSAA